MIYKILADTIVVIHLIWILFILAGFILTIIGFWQKKFFDRWIFRTIHLFGILYVSLLALMGKHCPLTILENILRRKYSPFLSYPGSFIIHYLEKLVYPEVNPLVILIPTIFISLFTISVFIIKPPKKIRSTIARVFALKRK